MKAAEFFERVQRLSPFAERGAVDTICRHFAAWAACAQAVGHLVTFTLLQHAMIPQHYPIEEGKLFAGEYPGHPQSDVAKVRLSHLVTLGIRTFVDLTAPADRMVPYEGLLAELEEEAGGPLRRISVPIADMGIPDVVRTMQTILRHIRESTAHAPAVYVHCWGGIGRTGTVVGCWLRECGYDAESSLAHVQHLYSSHMRKVLYHPESPQTPAQKNYIRWWQPGGDSPQSDPNHLST